MLLCLAQGSPPEDPDQVTEPEQPVSAWDDAAEETEVEDDDDEGTAMEEDDGVFACTCVMCSISSEPPEDLATHLP